MTKKAAKARRGNVSGSLSKQFMLSAVNVIAEKIVAMKVKNNGRVPWGYASKLLKEGKETFPKISMRTINNYILRLEEGKMRSNIGHTILVSQSTATLSTLTPSMEQNITSEITTPAIVSLIDSSALLNTICHGSSHPSNAIFPWQ
jgi:hypothetical protein